MHKSILFLNASLLALSLPAAAMAATTDSDQTTAEQKSSKAASDVKKGAKRVESKVDKAADKVEDKADKAGDKAGDKAADTARDATKPTSPPPSSTDTGESPTNWTERSQGSQPGKGRYEGSYARDPDQRGGRAGESSSAGNDAEQAMAKLERDAKDTGQTRAERRERTDNPQGVAFAAQAGYGTAGGYGAGIGLRGGYTFRNRIYLGGNVAYHFGTSTTVLDTTADKSLWFTGGELGYDLSAGPFIVRPVVGLGLGVTSEKLTGSEVEGGRDTGSRARPYVAPGASLMYPIGNFFVGADGRVMVLSDNNAVTIYGAAGYHL